MSTSLMTPGCEYFGGKLQFLGVFYAKNAANDRIDCIKSSFHTGAKTAFTLDQHKNGGS